MGGSIRSLTRREAVRRLVGGCAGAAFGSAAWAERGAAALLPGSAHRTAAHPTQEPELLIRGGRVVNADAVRTADVRIVGQTIAEVGPDLQPGPTARVVDATGKLLMPGGIDPHTHLSPPFVDDFTSGSAAALAGGITTIGTFAFPRDEENALQAMDRYEARVSQEAMADVILHAFTWPPTPEFEALLPRLAERGQPSLKIFMMLDGFGAQHAAVIQLLEAARDAGVVTMIHCEDAALLGQAIRRLEAEGRTSMLHYAESRPVVAEVSATHQAVAFCEATGAPMYMVHMSSERSLRAARRPDTAGLPLFIETRPFYLHLTEERFQEPDGAIYVGQPPLRTASDADALWQGLADGSIDVLATDHAPWTREQKLDPALDITNLRPGANNLQTMLPMYFSEGVRKGRMTLERFVETTSTNPARIFGLHPRKGVIQEGALADVVVWDPDRTDRISNADVLSNAGFTLYDGWEVTGWPVLTVRRGEVVFEDGTVTADPGSGRLLERTPWS